MLGRLAGIQQGRVGMYTRVACWESTMRRAVPVSQVLGELFAQSSAGLSGAGGALCAEQCRTVSGGGGSTLRRAVPDCLRVYREHSAQSSAGLSQEG